MKRLLILAVFAVSAACSSSNSNNPTDACNNFCNKYYSCQGIPTSGCGTACSDNMFNAGDGGACEAQQLNCLANLSCSELTMGFTDLDGGYAACAMAPCDGG